MTVPIDDIDRRIIAATQAGLPLVPRPYHAVADELGLTPDEVMRRLTEMLDSGVIRRIEFSVMIYTCFCYNKCRLILPN